MKKVIKRIIFGSFINIKVGEFNTYDYKIDNINYLTVKLLKTNFEEDNE